VNELEQTAVKLSATLLSTEKWAPGFTKAPIQHAQLIQTSAKYLVVLTKFFGQMAKDAPNFINWDHYNYQVQLDYNVDIVVNKQQIDNWDNNFIKVSLSPITAMTAIGAQAAEQINKIPLGIQSTDAAIQALGLKQVAGLVGKSVKPDGSIVDNPNPEMNVTDSIRNDIAQSIKNSLATGQTTDEATKAIQQIIANPARAARIANTESVAAYNGGVMEFGSQSGAVGKEWQGVDPQDDLCLGDIDDGIIDFNDSFSSGDDEPPAHPNCMCSIRLVYQSEMDAQDDGGDDGDDSSDDADGS
jgi:F like protein